MNWSKFLDNWAKAHPTTEPEQPTDDKILTWLTDGGESPLPLWPELPKGKKQ